MAKIDENIRVVMLKGEHGDKGDKGDGLPAGGKSSQYLRKASDSDYDYAWADIVPSDEITNDQIDTIIDTLD